MSRLHRAAEFIFAEYLEKDEKVTPFVDWSPNNVKTLMISSTMIGVEYFVPCNIGHGFSKYNYGKLGDLDNDLDVLNSGRPVRSVLRVLQGYKPCNNIEEVIICTEGYNRKLLQIDTDFQQISSNDIAEIFPRLYAITTVSGKAEDVFTLLNNDVRNTHHISDILREDDRFTVCPYLFHPDDWNKRYVLQPDLYLIDNDTLLTYFKSQDNTFKIDEDIKEFQTVNVEYPALQEQDNINCQFVYDIEESVMCVQSPNNCPPLNKLNSYTAICKNLWGSFEDYLQGWHNCKEIHITENGTVRLDGKTIQPLVGYEVIDRLPYDFQYLLFGKEPSLFKQEMQRQYGRVLINDSDRNEFFKLCKQIPFKWGYFLSLTDLSKLKQLKTLRIDCVQVLQRYKFNMGITEWGTLYSKVPSLASDGIYICGVHVENNNEKQFYDNYERKIVLCNEIQSEIRKNLGLRLSTIPLIIDVDNTGIIKGVSTAFCKLSSILHRLNDEN